MTQSAGIGAAFQGGLTPFCGRHVTAAAAIQAVRCDVDVRAVLDSRRFDIGKASRAAGWQQVSARSRTQPQAEDLTTRNSAQPATRGRPPRIDQTMVLYSTARCAETQNVHHPTSSWSSMLRVVECRCVRTRSSCAWATAARAKRQSLGSAASSSGEHSCRKHRRAQLTAYPLPSASHECGPHRL